MIPNGSKVRLPGGQIARVVGQQGDMVDCQAPDQFGQGGRTRVREHVLVVLETGGPEVTKQGPAAELDEDSRPADQGETDEDEREDAEDEETQQEHADEAAEAAAEEAQRKAEAPPEIDPNETTAASAESTRMQRIRIAEETVDAVAAEVAALTREQVLDTPDLGEQPKPLDLVREAIEDGSVEAPEFRDRMRRSLLALKRAAIAAESPADPPAPPAEETPVTAPAPTEQEIETAPAPPAEEPVTEPAPPAPPADPAAPAPVG